MGRNLDKLHGGMGLQKNIHYIFQFLVKLSVAMLVTHNQFTVKPSWNYKGL